MPSADVLSPAVVSALRAAGVRPEHVVRLAGLALEEDLAGGVDVTTEATVPEGLRGQADVVARAAGVASGAAAAAAVAQVTAARSGTTVVVEHLAPEGVTVSPGDVLLRVTGPVRTLLLAERSLLNLLTHTCGVATATRHWVDQLSGTGTVVRDTRKTLPLLRALDKAAVRAGGGQNHRASLSALALVKDNHVVAAGSVAAAYAAVRARAPEVGVEVEVDTLAQVREAVDAGVDLVLLDNMEPAALREAVALCRPAGVRTEASGGLTLETVREVAEAGVDMVAVGAITHSAAVLDLGVDLAVGSRPPGGGG